MRTPLRGLGGTRLYVVQVGDSPMGIAQKLAGNGAFVGQLIAANPTKPTVVISGIKTFSSLIVGERLIVPSSWSGMRVKTYGFQVTNTACSDPNTFNDDTLISSIQQCGGAVLEADTSFGADVSKIWAAVENSAATGASAGVSVAVGEAILVAALNSVGFAGLADVISALFTYILHELLLVLTATAVTDITTGVAIGAGAGYVGAVIGAVIGAIVALISIIIGGPSIQITNGNSYKATDYVRNNLQNAANFFSTNPSLIGMTPLWVANQFDLFLANPTWLWANQNNLGVSQPTPPNQGAGDALDLIYTSLPGAFELLNRAQLAAAMSLVSVTPSKLQFYQAVPTSGTINPNPNLIWNPVFSSTEMIWAPGDVVGGTLANGATATDGRAYDSCPNLFSNNIIAIINPALGGQITGQTNISSGICTLQIMFPSLTTVQCTKIFNNADTIAAYNKVINGAVAWALTQCQAPTVAQLGSGSVWNLEPADVQFVLSKWVAPPVTSGSTGICSPTDVILLAQYWVNTQCPAPTVAELKAAIGSNISDIQAQQILAARSNPTCDVANSKTSVLKTTAIVGALGAGALWWYSLHNGLSFTQGAKRVYSNVKHTVTKPFGRKRNPIDTVNVLPVKSSTGGRTVAFRVRISEMETILLEDKSNAVLYRYNTALVRFRPTTYQLTKIRAGEGEVLIFEDQIVDRLVGGR